MQCKYARLCLPTVSLRPESTNVVIKEYVLQNMFLFFPLRRCFDHQNEQHWHCFLDIIQCILLEFDNNIDRNHSDLMQDFFWMVFIATYPPFPGGELDAWDVCINMNGTFITTWLGDLGLQQLRDSQMPDAVCQFIFDELKEIIEHFFSTYINPLQSVAL